jgi:phosphohistidine phosphatase
MASGIELYLVRHGIAEERGPDWPDDGKRPLTKEGENRLREAAAGLDAAGVTLDVMLTSRLTRARQTAVILAKELPGRCPVEVLEALSPGSSYRRFLHELGAHAGRTRIACVGHEPDMGHLAARLIGAARPLAFKKGAVCCIDLDGLPPSGPGALRWLATPRMLRLMGRR